MQWKVVGQALYVAQLGLREAKAFLYHSGVMGGVRRWVMKVHGSDRVDGGEWLRMREEELYRGEIRVETLQVMDEGLELKDDHAILRWG